MITESVLTSSGYTEVSRLGGCTAAKNLKLRFNGSAAKVL